MNHSNHLSNGQVSAFIRLLAGCLIPIISIFVFMSIGIEYYSIGGFIPYLMLLFCPIAYLAMEYNKMSKDKFIDNIKKKLKN